MLSNLTELCSHHSTAAVVLPSCLLRSFDQLGQNGGSDRQAGSIGSCDLPWLPVIHFTKTKTGSATNPLQCPLTPEANDLELENPSEVQVARLDISITSCEAGNHRISGSGDSKKVPTDSCTLPKIQIYESISFVNIHKQLMKCLEYVPGICYTGIFISGSNAAKSYQTFYHGMEENHLRRTHCPHSRHSKQGSNRAYPSTAGASVASMPCSEQFRCSSPQGMQTSPYPRACCAVHPHTLPTRWRPAEHLQAVSYFAFFSSVNIWRGQDLQDVLLKSGLNERLPHGVQLVTLPKNPGRHPHIWSGKRSRPKPSRFVDAGSRPKHP